MKQFSNAAFYKGRYELGLIHFYKKRYSLRKIAEIFEVDHKAVKYQLIRLGVYKFYKKPVVLRKR